jgi:hypothetical protein
LFPTFKNLIQSKMPEVNFEPKPFVNFMASK